MSPRLRRAVVPVLAAAMTAVPLAVSTSGPARAATTPCSITGFTPRTVTVGLTPVEVTFAPTVTGCAPGGWSVEGGDYAFFADDVEPRSTFAPVRNGETGPLDVLVSTYTDDHQESAATFPEGLSLRRSTSWDRFGAGPEPVRKGATITVRARLRAANWERRALVGLPSRTVAVEFRTATGSYRKIRTATTGSDGSLTTTVTAVRDGYWRVRYGGSATTGTSRVVGDFVDVR